MAAIKGLGTATTDAAGHFRVPTRPKGANVLFEAYGQTQSGSTLRLLGLVGADDSVTLDLASTLAAVRALRPGRDPGVRRTAVSVGALRSAVSTALVAHPAEGLKAAGLLVADGGALSIGGLEDLENALVELGRVDAPLQLALDKLDALIDGTPTAADKAAAAASDAFMGGIR